MPGFESLANAIHQGAALAPITAGEVQFENLWSDEVAVGIVMADVNAALSYEQAKSFVTSIEVADDLVRGYVRIRPWP